MSNYSRQLGKTAAPYVKQGASQLWQGIQNIGNMPGNLGKSVQYVGEGAGNFGIGLAQGLGWIKDPATQTPVTFVKQSPVQSYYQPEQYQSFPNQSYGNVNYSTPISFNTDPVNPITTASSALRQPVVNTPSLGVPENMGGIKTGNIPIPGVSPFADPASSATTGFDWGKYFNKDTIGLGISGLQGVGSLLQGWGALKNAKLGKQQLAENRRMYDQNYAAQRTLTNNAIADQNAYKTAQGMSNLSNLVL